MAKSLLESMADANRLRAIPKSRFSSECTLSSLNIHPFLLKPAPSDYTLRRHETSCHPGMFYPRFGNGRSLSCARAWFHKASSTRSGCVLGDTAREAKSLVGSMTDANRRSAIPESRFIGSMPYAFTSTKRYGLKLFLFKADVFGLLNKDGVFTNVLGVVANALEEASYKDQV